MSNRIQSSDTIQKLHDFLDSCNQRHYNTFAIVVRNEEGEEEIHPRIQRPCFGELRNYREKSKNRPGDPFPSDLVNNFPEGTPIGVALYITSSQEELKKALYSPLNPWLGKNEEFLNNIIPYYRKDSLKGVILTTGDIPPTPMVATFMKGRSFINEFQCYKKLIEVGVKEEIAMPLAMVSGGPAGSKSISFQGYSPVFSGYSNLERVIDRNPVDLDEGMLWSERCDYNRPDIAFAFVEDRQKNPLHCIRYSSVENFVNKFKLLER